VAWDSSRPVNYRRLVKEWAIYAAIMMAIALVLLRGRNPAGLIAGVVLSLPLYVGFSAAMAKFGYQRKTLSEMRTPRASTSSAGTSSGNADATTTGRGPVKPTKRTNASTRRR
jgi:hypothetical protein